MAHFAELDKNNIVKRVVVVNNQDCGFKEFPESEIFGQEFLYSVGLKGNWKQTSYNNNFRKRYASPGYLYDEINDVFISPQPHPSWMLNESFDWCPPIPYPQGHDPENCLWDEETQEWVILN